MNCMQECGRSQIGEVLRSDVGTVSVLRLHNPAGHSALDRAMIEAAVQHLDALEKDDAVRAVVLTATGRYFCTGASLAAGRSRPLTAPAPVATGVECSRCESSSSPSRSSRQ